MSLVHPVNLPVAPSPVPEPARAAWPRGFSPLVAAQFCSGWADQALLIVTIALLQVRGWPLWWAPLLKIGFNLAYVLLAPWAGPLADAVPKARLMAWMNALKFAGVAALALGLHPLAAFVVVGLGAAGYAPAKYGLVCELVPAERLVQANAWLEVTVVAAALLGAVLGGLLVSPLWLQAGWAPWAAAGGEPALRASLALLLALYALAAWLNRAVPDSGVRHARAAQAHALRDFWCDHRRLWRDAEGGLSLAVTTLFWGLGATLQFVVLRWAGEWLGLPLDRAAPLQAAVGVGVVLGAWAAGRWVPLARARHLLWAGVVMGLMMPLLAPLRSLAVVLPMLVAVGAVGGLMVVPLNALLQHRGHQLMSAGRSIAVQGFNENASVLAMLAVYAGLLALDVPILPLMTGLGMAVAALLLALIAREARRRRRAGG